MPAKTRVSNGTRRPRRRLGAKAIEPNAFSALLETIRPDVENRLEGFFDARIDAIKSYGEDVVVLLAALRDLCLRGGKRLRPALVVAGYRATSESADLEPALDVGVALELLHAYMLVHDDWMDQDRMRRGGPAVHVLLTKRYRSTHLGQASAVLAGDLGVALATEALARVEVPPERVPQLFSVFAQMQSDAIAGQELDVLGREADVERVYTLKTGSYTVRGPLVLGALLAGSAQEVITALERFALPLGIAFQLRDDLLSAFGDPARTGKPFGNDIRSGKRTLLMARGLELARGADRSRLRGAWGNRRATRSHLERATEILETCGARGEVERRIKELVTKGLGALKKGPITRAGHELLTGAAEVLADRWS